MRLSSVLHTRKRKFAVATAAVLVVGTGAAVAAEVGPSGHHGEVLTLQYSHVDACRIVDTRSGIGGKTGKFANGESHAYTITDGTCGLTNEVGVSIISAFNSAVTATQPSAAGFVRIWGDSPGDPVSEPNATFLNYPNASPGGFDVIGPVRVGNTGDFHFKVKNYGGPTHIVIDVLGHWDTE